MRKSDTCMECRLGMQLEERSELQLKLRRTSCVQQPLNFPTQSPPDLGEHINRCKEPSPTQHTKCVVGLHTKLSQSTSWAVAVHCPLRSVPGQQRHATCVRSCVLPLLAAGPRSWHTTSNRTRRLSRPIDYKNRSALLPGSYPSALPLQRHLVWAVGGKPNTPVRLPVHLLAAHGVCR